MESSWNSIIQNFGVSAGLSPMEMEVCLLSLNNDKGRASTKVNYR